MKLLMFLALVPIAALAQIPSNHVVELPTRVGKVKISMSFPDHINFCFDNDGNMKPIQASSCCPSNWNSVAPQADGCKPPSNRKN